MQQLPELSRRESRLLEAFIRHIIINNLAALAAQDVVDDPKKFGVPAPFIEVTFQHLIEKDIVNFEVLAGRGSYKIGLMYSDAVYELAEKMELLDQDTDKADEQENDGIPASDRFVSVGDNLGPVVKAKEAIEKLTASIVGANELYADAEERIQISREIGFLNEVLSKPKIHVLTVWDYTKNNSTLKFLANQTISFIVREDAGKVLEALHQVYAFLKSFF